MIEYDPNTHDCISGIGVDGATCYECNRHVVRYWTIRNRRTDKVDAVACEDCGTREQWPLERAVDGRQADFVGAT